MHCPTGEILEIGQDQIEEFERQLKEDSREYSVERQMVSLTESEANKCSTMPRQQRRGWMRNKPCPCGSRKKFKNCCWSKFS